MEMPTELLLSLKNSSNTTDSTENMIRSMKVIPMDEVYSHDIHQSVSYSVETSVLSPNLSDENYIAEVDDAQEPLKTVEHHDSRYDEDKETSSKKVKRKSDKSKESKKIEKTRRRERRRENVEKYCICDNPNYDTFMISCDKCNVWYHGDCVGVNEKDATEINTYYCPECQDQLHWSSVEKCQNYPCQEKRRDQSKYCSDKCGMNKMASILKLGFVNKALKKAVEYIFTQSEQTKSAVFDFKDPELQRPFDQQLRNLLMQDELLQLDKFEGNISAAQKELEKLNNESKQLEDLIAYLSSVPDRQTTEEVDKQEGKEEPGKKRKAVSDDVECISCNRMVSLTDYQRHMDKCFSSMSSKSHISHAMPMLDYKGEGFGPYCDAYDPKRKVYCKKLRANCPFHTQLDSSRAMTELCGFTLQYEDRESCCQRSRKDCALHHGWERLRRAEILQEQARQRDLVILNDMEVKVLLAKALRRQKYFSENGKSKNGSKRQDEDMVEAAPNPTAAPDPHSMLETGTNNPTTGESADVDIE
eukprot:TRINITY_DN4263_c0_g1_i2.p1 TRINITY_DN4263_c0_g1~~TRINITY_DN4263_c0_g1_i2.p1  ORF type:complete len:530 (+),score=97.17 TRINITY_DN4263_c0_g1_i2:715-2304(+)